MEEKGFISRFFEKKGLLLLMIGILILPILIIGANTKTGLFSRASSSEEKGFTTLSTDPQTGEYYDLLITAYPFKTIIENNIANKATVGFRINGARVAPRKILFGAVQNPKTTEYTKTFNFTTDTTGTTTTFVSEQLLLPDNPNTGCIDLHADASRTQQSYIATFCYSLSFFNRAGTTGRIYAVSANPYIEVTYQGNKPAGVLSMTTSFNKYTNAQGPSYTGANFKGSRVNYFSQDDDSNARDFKNLTYNIQGLTTGLTLTQRNELCTINSKYPEKYLRYGRSIWYEGGDLIKLSQPGSGGCSFAIKQESLLGGWMNLWLSNMFQLLKPTTSVSKTPTNTRITTIPTTITRTSIIPTKTPTPIKILPTSANKIWYMSFLVVCPNGTQPQASYNTHWYWWDSVSGANAGIKSPAIVSGPSTRTYNLSLIDSMGPLRPKTIPAGMTNATTFVSWNGTFANNSSTIIFEARGSACRAQ